MGLMDKIWDEVFAGPRPTSDTPTNPHNATQASSFKKIPLEINVPESPLVRSGSVNTPTSCPTTEVVDRRHTTDFGSNSLGGSARGPRGSSAASRGIHISDAPQGRRASLDSARSLPTGFRLPEILSPGPSSRRDENVWRSVFHPGSNRAGMESLGSSKFDKADPKGPSVYDWYNPLNI